MTSHYILFHLRNMTTLLLWLIFSTLCKGSLGSGKHLLYVPFPHRIWFIYVSDNICFRICFWGSIFVFDSAKNMKTNLAPISSVRIRSNQWTKKTKIKKIEKEKKKEKERKRKRIRTNAEPFSVQPCVCACVWLPPRAGDHCRTSQCGSKVSIRRSKKEKLSIPYN